MAEELANLADDPARAEVVAELLGHIEAERGELLAKRGYAFGSTTADRAPAVAALAS